MVSNLKISTSSGLKPLGRIFVYNKHINEMQENID